MHRWRVQLDGSSFWIETGIPRVSRGQRWIPAVSACHLHGNMLCPVDFQTLARVALQLRRLRHRREGVVRTSRLYHIVQRKRGQVDEQRREAVDRQPAGGAPSVRLCPGALRYANEIRRAAAHPGALRSSSSNRIRARCRRLCHCTWKASMNRHVWAQRRSSERACAVPSPRSRDLRRAVRCAFPRSSC